MSDFRVGSTRDQPRALPDRPHLSVQRMKFRKADIRMWMSEPGGSSGVAGGWSAQLLVAETVEELLPDGIQRNK